MARRNDSDSGPFRIAAPVPRSGFPAGPPIAVPRLHPDHEENHHAHPRFDPASLDPASLDPASRRPCRAGASRRRRNPAAPFSRCPRGPRRLHLRGRPLVRLDRRRDRGAADLPPGAGTLRPVLAGRQPDRFHRAVRRRRTGLRHAFRRRCSETVDLLPRHRAASDPLGLRQHRLRLVARRRADPLPLAAGRKRGRRGAAPRSPAGRWTPDAAPHAARRGGRLVTGGGPTRLFAALPGLPCLEALRRWLGSGPLRVRHRDSGADADHRRPAVRPGPNVDRLPDLLHLRPFGDEQPLFLRHGERRHADLDRLGQLGRPLAGQRREWPYRLRAGGHPPSARHGRRRGSGAHRDHRPHRRAAQPPFACVGGAQHRAFRHLTHRQAARLRGPGRALFGPGGEGGDAHPDCHRRRPREMAGLVPGRDADRLHLGRERRGGDPRGVPGGRGSAGATHGAGAGDALQPALVTGRRPDRLQRQGRPPLRAHRRGQGAR